MKNDPILITDLMKTLELLPDEETFPEESVSIPIEDSVTKQQRLLLFKKQRFLSSDNKDEVFWTSGVYFIAAKKPKKQLKEGTI